MIVKVVPKRADVDVSPTKNATNCKSLGPLTYLTYRGGGAGEVRLSTPDSPRQVFGYGSRKCFSRKSPDSTSVRLSNYLCFFDISHIIYGTIRWVFKLSTFLFLGIVASNNGCFLYKSGSPIKG